MALRRELLPTGPVSRICTVEFLVCEIDADIQSLSFRRIISSLKSEGFIGFAWLLI